MWICKIQKYTYFRTSNKNCFGNLWSRLPTFMTRKYLLNMWSHGITEELWNTTTAKTVLALSEKKNSSLFFFHKQLCVLYVCLQSSLRARKTAVYKSHRSHHTPRHPEISKRFKTAELRSLDSPPPPACTQHADPILTHTIGFKSYLWHTVGQWRRDTKGMYTAGPGVQRMECIALASPCLPTWDSILELPKYHQQFNSSWSSQTTSVFFPFLFIFIYYILTSQPWLAWNLLAQASLKLKRSPYHCLLSAWLKMYTTGLKMYTSGFSKSDVVWLPGRILSFLS